MENEITCRIIGCAEPIASPASEYCTACIWEINEEFERKVDTDAVTCDREWEAYHDEDCQQWQVINGAEVLATGIETPAVALLAASAPKLLKAVGQIKRTIKPCFEEPTCDTIDPHDTLNDVLDIVERCVNEVDCVAIAKARGQLGWPGL